MRVELSTAMEDGLEKPVSQVLYRQSIIETCDYDNLVSQDDIKPPLAQKPTTLPKKGVHYNEKVSRNDAESSINVGLVRGINIFYY